MPACYAHRTFGRRVFRALPEGALKECISTRFDLFEIGLQGPDILFFYHPLNRHPINRKGHALHDETASSFLTRPVCSHTDRAGLAYLLGFICHFTLDSECHSLVEYYMEQTGRGHSDIETELERTLLSKDGLDPMRTVPAGWVQDTRNNGEVIAPFYDLSGREIKTALTSMKLVSKVLTPANPVKQSLLTRGTRMLGEHHLARELVMDWNPDPVYREACAALGARLDAAVPVAIALMEDYLSWHTDGGTLSKRFDRTFSVDEEELTQLRRRERNV